MHKITQFFFLFLLGLTLAGCGGGGGGGGGFTGSGGTTGGTTVSVSSLVMLADPATLDVSGTGTVEITVVGLDSSNLAVEGAVVTFSTNAGFLNNISNTTGADGTATATLNQGTSTAGSTITVTASVGGVTQTLAVSVVDSGTTGLDDLRITASPAQLDTNGTGTVAITAFAEDASNNAVEGVTVSFSASAGLLSNIQPTTGAAGTATATLTTGGDAGLVGTTIAVTVTAGAFTDTVNVPVVATTSPVASIILLTDTDELVAGSGDTATLTAVALDANSVAVPGVNITFSGVTGTGSFFTTSPATTDINGRATTTLDVGTATAPQTLTVTATEPTGGANDTITVDVVTVSSGGVTPNSITLLVSKTELNSGGSDSVTVTAIAKDASNVLLAGVDVAFSTDSGALQITQGTTDASGQATAVLTTSGDPSNRTITVTATSGALTQTIPVSVTGTTIVLTGQTSLIASASTTLTLTLTDSAGNPIVGTTLAVSSLEGNTISAPSGLVTNSGGQVQVTVTADSGQPTDTITATALGATGTLNLTVSTDVISFVTPAAATEIPINTPTAVTVQFDAGTAPATATFNTTRGTFTTSGAVAFAGAPLQASNTIQSSNSGPALISVTTDTGVTVTQSVEFIATTPATMTISANKTTIGTNGAGETDEQAVITVIVRDAANNLVKNQTINFTIVTDPSGGTLSTGTAITDSVGRASTSFIAGANTTALNEVEVQAQVSGTSITASQRLTVANQPLFVRLGASHLLTAEDSVRYNKPYTALVTDAAGNPVASQNVTIKITPTYYDKGRRIFGTTWVAISTIDGNNTDADLNCVSEDLDKDGILDAGEDINKDGSLTPGGIASVPVTVTTDADGFAEVNIIYAKDFADWVQVELTATVGATGTESTDIVEFLLPALASDLTDPNVAPPGLISPFGTSNSCSPDLVLTATPVTLSASGNVALALTDGGPADPANPGLLVDSIDITASVAHDAGNTGGLVVTAADATTDAVGGDNTAAATSAVTVTGGASGDFATITYSAPNAPQTTVIVTIP